MKLYTLLHIKDATDNYSQDELDALKRRINPYFLCAAQLHLSLKKAGVAFAIVTNKKAVVESLNNNRFDMEIVELNFSLEVPEGIQFYSAHFKIEVFKYFSTLEEDYVGLVDSDVTCINSVTLALQKVLEQKLPLYYDITNQMVPRFGITNVIADKEKISGKPSVGLWAGGEYISGSPEFFGALYTEISQVKERYFAVCKSLFHEGDEMLTSVALENMMTRGYPVFDAGNLGIIERFWSINTEHHQRPLSSCTNCFLLHLPADKDLLASLDESEVGEAFLKKYKKHVLFRLPRRYGARLYQTLKNRRSKKVSY